MAKGNAAWKIERLEEVLGDVKREVAALEAQLDGYDHREKFEKCKTALAVLYYDSSYSSRSRHVNAVLDDPEIQGWIKEKE